MSNKTELHLKTIHFQQALSAHPRIQPQSSFTAKRPSTQNRLRQTISQKQQIKSSTKRASFHQNQYQEEFLTRFHQLEINRRSLKVFTATSKSQFFRQSGQFPRREPQVRNTNAFKYFINSTINKVPPAQEKYLDEFYRKIATAISENATKANLVVQRQPRAKTECARTKTECTSHEPRVRSRPMSTSTKQIRGNSKVTKMNPEPWQTTADQPFLTQF